MVARWDIPMRVAAEPVSVTGDIVYVPGPSAWPWALGGLALVALVLLSARRFGARRVLPIALVVLVAIDVTRVAGLTFIVVGGAGARLRQAADVGVVDLVGWGLGLAAAVRVRRRRLDGPMAAGVAALLLAIVGGLLDWSDIGRSQLAVATPAVLARACIAAVAGIGLGLALAVLVETSRPRRSAR